MHFLHRVFAPRNRPFIVYLALLAAILVGGEFYKGRFKRRSLASLSASVRRSLTSEDDITQAKNERSSLQFLIPNLSGKFPILTNATLSRQWKEATPSAHLDSAVCQNWRAYLKHISPLVQQRVARLDTFIALQQGYALEVEQLAHEPFVTNKAARFSNLRTKKFAVLFSNPVYVADAGRFESAARTIQDPQTATLRSAYEISLAESVTNLNPKLADYGRAFIAFQNQSAALTTRIAELNEQLGDVTEHGSAPQSVLTITSQTNPSQSITQGFFKTYIPQEQDFVTFEVAVGLFGFLITLPVEMRDRRWLKIGASVVLTHLGLLALRTEVSRDILERTSSIFGFYGFLLPAALVAAIWAPDFAFLGSKLFLELIDSSGPDETEDLRLAPAYRAVHQGDFRCALQLLKPRLREDPWHYEALLLKAKLHRRLNHRWRAWLALNKANRNPRLSISQRQHLAHLRHHLSDRDHPYWSLSRVGSGQVRALSQRTRGEWMRGES